VGRVLFPYILLVRMVFSLYKIHYCCKAKTVPVVPTHVAANVATGATVDWLGDDRQGSWDSITMSQYCGKRSQK
jgi:hypothetical protein